MCERGGLRLGLRLGLRESGRRREPGASSAASVGRQSAADGGTPGPAPGAPDGGARPWCHWRSCKSRSTSVPPGSGSYISQSASKRYRSSKLSRGRSATGASPGRVGDRALSRRPFFSCFSSCEVRSSPLSWYTRLYVEIAPAASRRPSGGRALKMAALTASRAGRTLAIRSRNDSSFVGVCLGAGAESGRGCRVACKIGIASRAPRCRTRAFAANRRNFRRVKETGRLREHVATSSYAGNPRKRTAAPWSVWCLLACPAHASRGGSRHERAVRPPARQHGCQDRWSVASGAGLL